MNNKAPHDEAKRHHRFVKSDAGVMRTPERLARERAAGMWPDQTLLECLDTAVAKRPHDTALVAHCVEAGRETSLTYVELASRVDRVAHGLRNRFEVGVGDVVAVQLPNWWQFPVIHLACLRIGAVTNPLMPIFRERELKFMLTFGEAKVLILPDKFRNFDHAAMGRELIVEVPNIDHLLIVNGCGEGSLDNLVATRSDDAPLDSALACEPNDVMQLLYTSGTTGEPKGVMHTSNTLMSSLCQFSARLGLGAHDVVFMPSPFAHQTGFCYGMMMALTIGAPLVTMDIWQPRLAASLIERYGVTYTFAATPFLSDLLAVPEIEGRDLSRFRVFVTSGAPVPPKIVEDAHQSLGTNVITGWGMTEVGVATSTLLDEQSLVSPSDGVAVPGGEVRVTGVDGAQASYGDEGRLQYRGSTLFVGYFKKPDLYGVDDEGWFDTGDLAKMEENGHIHIIGRSKDIVIRGGENVPVVEVENLIHELPEVRDVALVAMPDSRLGEKGCAFVTIHEGQDLTFEKLIAFLETKKLAKQYLPERLEILQDMPRTPSGKIQKFVLRNIAKSFADDGS